jgi:TPP-dependent pyruvate/acetoin dehydrogenase alpha subunit
MDLDPELMLFMFRTMVKIREFEETAGRLESSGSGR